MAEVILFALGDTPVERPVDFEVYYANTPYIREMVVLYLVAHTVAGVLVTTLCRRWLAGVAGSVWLRRGLRILIVGFLSNLTYDAVKLIGIIARWNGQDWDFLVVKVAPLVGLVSTVGVATGFIVPLVGPRLSDRLTDLRTHARLRPLWTALRAATPDISRGLPLHWWALDLRLTRRIAEIHDGRLALRAYRDPSIEAMAAVRAREAKLPAEEAEAVTEAAVLAAAMELKRCNVHPPSRPADLLSAGEAMSLRRPALVRVAHALDRSPIVAEAVRSCRSAGKQEDSVHGSAE